MALNKLFEVIVIGGSYSGLSAAMTLGRSLRNVLVIDSGVPCNKQTPHSHNFLTQDGESPAAISALGRQQVEKYDTVRFLDDLAIRGERIGHGFLIETQSGEICIGKKLIFATGIKDLMPDIGGFAACWGISVIHCPYCHGYEFRGHKTGLFANGDKAVHLAGLIRNLTNDLTIFTHGRSNFTAEQTNRLKRANIHIIDTKIMELVQQNGYLEKVLLRDGSQIQLDALYAAIPFSQHSDIPASLGCELTEQGHIKTDSFHKTTISGIFACGDNSAAMRSVANAVSTGNLAGAMANMELTNEQF